MNYCKKCDRTFGDYNHGEANPNGDFVQVKNKETNWEWKTKCPHCGNIDEEITDGIVRVSNGE